MMRLQWHTVEIYIIHRCILLRLDEKLSLEELWSDLILWSHNII
jgi:hypothetical protein